MSFSFKKPIVEVQYQSKYFFMMESWWIYSSDHLFVGSRRINEEDVPEDIRCEWFAK
mgnify:CR=1 FL=1